ncbi:CpsD/CapB family tyrosine-protein kinase [Litchfieldia alkalitelluris]|uniref:CpsD/CapB family tyrosine-protein kinase n=1 Tax=Litchfieldia alkalitelluris TaxID=304268 RepID=UPI0009978BA5|nr:CpsD/CapB family tyrosine-protein kinase [Litchfieldia alkalitelluris]
MDLNNLLKKFNKKLNRTKNLINENPLVTFLQPTSKISEEFRTIRTNIKFSEFDPDKKTILVTSPNGGEGKSVTVANLGVSMAQQGQRVLIVDANLRQPSLHCIFKMDNSLGLSSILTGKSVLEGTVSQTDISKLDILTSGPIPSNPAELLGSHSMRKLMNKVIENYDVILFDSPPVLQFADTTVIANQCEGVILVLEYGQTENDEAVEAKRILEFANAKVVGAVINKAS